MDQKSRRRQLTADYKRNHPEAGIYRVVNTATGRVLLGSALNLASVKSKVEFARSTNSPGALGALDHRLASDVRQYGLDAFSLEILEVLDIVGGSSGNHDVETSIKEVGADVEKGDNLSVALSRKTIFPPMLLRMVAAGEATGKIDTMLEKMADFWDEEIEAMLDALTSLIEPLLIVFLGVIVGGIVIAMFLPIFKLNEVVSQNKSN